MKIPCGGEEIQKFEAETKDTFPYAYSEEAFLARRKLAIKHSGFSFALVKWTNVQTLFG